MRSVVEIHHHDNYGGKMSTCLIPCLFNSLKRFYRVITRRLGLMFESDRGFRYWIDKRYKGKLRSWTYHDTRIVHVSYV